MRILDEVVVAITPGELGDDHMKCLVKARVTGKREVSYTREMPTDDFESMFHRFMGMAEKEIVEIIKKEREGS
jgi:hypothetical protein